MSKVKMKKRGMYEDFYTRDNLRSEPSELNRTFIFFLRASVVILAIFAINMLVSNIRWMIMLSS